MYHYALALDDTDQRWLTSLPRAWSETKQNRPVYNLKASYILAIQLFFGNDAAANEFVAYIPRGRAATNHAVGKV